MNVWSYIMDKLPHEADDVYFTIMKRWDPMGHIFYIAWAPGAIMKGIHLAPYSSYESACWGLFIHIQELVMTYLPTLNVPESSKNQIKDILKNLEQDSVVTEPDDDDNDDQEDPDLA